MAANNGVNASTAADLLRQAMMQNSARHEDEATQDQIPSNAGTPSGVQTPVPEFSDKRFPGISHSYFGQVGNQISPRAARESVPVTTPFGDSFVNEFRPVHHRETKRPRRSSASSGSMVMVQREHAQDSPPSPHEKPQKTKVEELSDRPDPKFPPTPVSSSSSILQKEAEALRDGKVETDAGTLTGITQALKNFVVSKGMSAGRERRHTAAPISSVTSDPVHAHISNPSSAAPSPDSCKLQDAPSHISEPNADSVHRGLTVDATDESREKTTPPQTPRVSNHEASRQEEQDPQDQPETERGASPASDTDRSTDLGSTYGVTSSSFVGVLTLKIPEARGLRPSYDPYFVTTCEYSEFVSQGPKHDDDMDVDQEEKKDRKSQLAAATAGAVPMRRTDSDIGKPMAILMKSRQSSNNSQVDNREAKASTLVTDPQWDHTARFDITGAEPEIDVSLYDRGNNEKFLGRVRLCLNLTQQSPALEQWFPLEARAKEDEHPTGEVYMQVRFEKAGKKTFGPNDFQVLRLIGKGTFGQVFQVRKKDTGRIYAMKVLSKKVIIQKKEVAHTLGERNILVRTAMADSPFIVGLKFSFQTPTDLYLVTDFMSGGELFWHLQKEGRFNEPRAKFYIAELILALKHLHEHDIVYRDLKPENILLDANGHIALCDFGLSKANLTKNDTTNTFCGTTEYLAPEVLLDEQGYTKMVDFWSLGVLVFEMCCGWSPFYAEDTQQMYKNIAFGKVRFPRDALSTEGRNFVKGLLNRNPRHRLGATKDAQELIEHPFFADIDWDALARKDVTPPFKPKLSSNIDVSNFDPEFTNAMTTSSSLNARAAALAGGGLPTSTPLSPTMQDAFKGFTFVDESTIENQFRSRQDHRHDDFMDDDHSLQRTRTRDRRMSGVERTAGEDTVFTGGDFDI